MIPLKSDEHKWLFCETDLQFSSKSLKKDIHEIINQYQSLVISQKIPYVTEETLNITPKMITDVFQKNATYADKGKILRVLKATYQGVREQKIRKIILYPTFEDVQKFENSQRFKKGLQIAGAALTGIATKVALDFFLQKYDVFKDLGINKANTEESVFNTLRNIEKVSEEFERIGIVKQYIDRGGELNFEIAMLILFTTLEKFFSESLKTKKDNQKRSIGAILKYCRSLKPKPIITREWYDKVLKSTSSVRNRVSHGDFDFSKTTKDELFEIVNTIESFMKENKHLKEFSGNYIFTKSFQK
ncbi:hypothetical protein CHISP_2659 [Chitinispirillum alkaliphilum]|nr:hypothetical protein CHISP_2659 [Chitinispirillum alkaliphilum]